MIYSENILICIAIPLMITLLFIRGNARRFVLAFLLGMGICLISAYINGFINSISGYTPENMAVYISPLVEETLKFFPVLFYMFVFVPSDRYLLVTSVAIGAGFATFENCCYLFTVGAEKLSFVLIRGLAVGTMHVASVTLLASVLIIGHRYSALSFPPIVAAISTSSMLHALYNLLVSEGGWSSYVGYAFPFFSAWLLFYAFRTRVLAHVNADGS